MQPFKQASLSDLLSSRDVLVSICNQIKKVKDLAKLSAVCRTLSGYLLSASGGRHWMDCAIAMGTGTLSDDLPRANNLRYAAAMLICPWVSKHVSIPIVEIGNGRRWSERPPCKRDMQSTDLEWGVHADGCIAVKAYENDMTMRVVTLPLRPQAMPTFVQRVFTRMSALETEAMVFSNSPEKHEQCVDRHVIRRCHSDDDILTVKFASLHSGVTIASQYDHFDHHGSVSFISAAGGHLLRRLEIMTKVKSSPTVLSRPGELWMLDPTWKEIRYYGPRDDMAFNLSEPESVAGRAYPAFLLAEYGYGEEAVAAMRSHQADIATTRFDNGETLLIAAARASEDSRVNVKHAIIPLLEAGSNPDAMDFGGDCAMSWAVKCGRADLLKLLLDRGLGVRRGILHLAVEQVTMAGIVINTAKATRVQRRIVSALLDHGVDVNQTDDDNRTALMIAAIQADHQSVELLLNRRADPTIADAITDIGDTEFWGLGCTALMLMDAECVFGRFDRRRCKTARLLEQAVLNWNK